ncbi:MAG: zinc-ribbon domain containing protein [Chloroflexi bacterium]|nr:zinc-ribbon domain containing protein [Chloroflexota bacterium]
MNQYQDRTLTCVDCGQPFTFSADDQAYHASKGYTNEPKRCASCRQARRGDRGYGGYSGGGYSSGDYDRPRREMHPAVCAQCGKQTEVPFRPRGDRPVYCSDCYSRQSPAGPRRY